MASKKRKKLGKNFGKAAKAFFADSVRFLLKALPLAAVVLLTGSAFVGVRQVLYQDSHLTLRSIAVEPMQALTEAQRKSLESRYLGKNILKVELARIAEDLEKDPRIKSADVFRRFPSTLRIEIRERIPVALVRFQPHGPAGLISEDGIVLDTFSKETFPAYPVIEVFQAGLKDPERGLRFRAKGFVEIVQFLKAYGNHPLAAREKITKIGLDRLGNVSVVLGEGPQIRLGRTPAARLEVFDKITPLLETEERKKIEYVDLQFGDVVIKRKR